MTDACDIGSGTSMKTDIVFFIDIVAKSDKPFLHF